MKPSRVTWNIGTDRFGRRLFVFVENGIFTLHRQASDQRDEAVWVELSAEQMRLIAEVAQ